LQEPNSRANYFAVVTLTALLEGEGPGSPPDPSAVQQMLAAGAVAALLRLMASHHGHGKERHSGEAPKEQGKGDEEAAKAAAFKPLRLIACDPRGEAAIAAADSAGPLVAALSSAFSRPLPDAPDASQNKSHNATTPDVRSDLVALIGKLMAGRPGLGRAFLAAGIVREMARFLGPARAGTERNLAMQLAEKLVQHAPGACDVMRAEGVFTLIHRLTLPVALASGKRRCVRDEGAGVGTPPLESPSGYSEAEAAQAAALLCLAACHCGGVLKIGENTDGVPIQYTAGGVTVSNRDLRDDDPPSDTSAPRPSRKVCAMCGAAPEKPLQVCTRCRGARYCGRSCQAAHWPVHKSACRG
jgi:hypothetical protein